jgi:hypothetical protein
VDDVINVWFVNKKKPRWDEYKKRATKKGVPFELSKEVWEKMIVDECVYCHRSPTTWFGIDRIVPLSGYVNDNVVTCCFDCNLDKHVQDVDTMKERNERIAKRVADGVLVIANRERVILHQGTHKSSKKVCVYGKMYVSRSEASRTVGKSKNYVSECIRNGRYQDDIFDITDNFYEFATKHNLKNITKKMYLLFARM